VTWGKIHLALVGAIVMVTATVSTPAAVAQTQQQIDWCEGKAGATPDQRITGCTAVISSGRWVGQNLSWAFYDRGIGYEDKGDIDHALADYGQALKLNPKDDNRAIWRLCQGTDSKIGIPACTLIINSGSSVTDRAGAYRVRGLFVVNDQPDRAIADFTQAIQLEPKNWLNYLQRGRAHLKAKQIDRALSDAEKAVELSTANAWSLNFRGNVFQAKGDVDRTVADYVAAGNIASTTEEFHETIWNLIRIDRVEGAAGVIGKIYDPDLMMTLRVMRAYEKLWSNARTNEALSLSGARKRRIEHAQSQSQKNPRQIPYMTDLVVALEKNREYGEAERVAYETLGNPSIYEKNLAAEQWLRGNLANTLLLDGKLEQSKAVMGGLPPDAANEILNYAETLRSIGHYSDAIQYAQMTRGHTSPYGTATMNGVLACANFKLGKSADAAAAIDDMLKSPEEGTQIIIRTLLCLDREEDAARLMLKYLKEYPGDLTKFQDCGDDPATPADDRETEVKVLKLFDRPDIRSVVDGIGRIRQECAK
jgi:tetratricopeptide (TPR) repeat protein